MFKVLVTDPLGAPGINALEAAPDVEFRGGYRSIS